MKHIIRLLEVILFLFVSTSLNAASISLTSSTQCSSGNAINGISSNDVTGNVGGSSDCWGTFDGNDPGPSGDGFSIGGTIFDFVAKQDIGGALEGDDIGLVVDSGTSGTWSYDSSLFDPFEFLIVLKAANSPGYAAWLFEGSDADSSSGDWSIAWTTGGGPNPSSPGLSHFAIYASNGGPIVDPGPTIPEPGVVALLGIGLMGVGLSRLRRKPSIS